MLRCWAENSVRKLIPAGRGIWPLFEKGGGREEEIEACGLRACCTVRTEGTVGFLPPAQKKKIYTKKEVLRARGRKRAPAALSSSCGCLCRRGREILEILGIY